MAELENSPVTRYELPKGDPLLPKVIVNGQEIDEYTYKLTDPRNVFTQPKEVSGVDIDELLREQDAETPWGNRAARDKKILSEDLD